MAPFFPAGDQGLRLEPHIYEMALFELLKTDSEAFLNTVRAWRPELYRDARKDFKTGKWFTGLVKQPGLWTGCVIPLPYFLISQGRFHTT